MYNIVRFIKLNQFLLFFIIMESVSVSLLIQNNKYQSNKIIQFTTQYTSKIYEFRSSVFSYLKLKKTNDILAKENARLNTIISQKKSDDIETVNIDKKYNYISAKVINNSTNKRNNFITLNKGKVNGVKKGMGVVSNNGVIGVVHSVSKNYSLVLSILNSKSSTGVLFKKTNHPGILKWDGFDYRIATIKDLPYHVKIKKGDTVMSSNYSTIYPEKIGVGTILNFKKNKETADYHIEIDLFEDFNSLEYVYVVYSKEAKEQITLEKTIENE